MADSFIIPESLKPGEQLEINGAIYTIGNFLGAGAFGSVYACSDRWANELAIKVISPRGRPNEEVRAAFAREARNLLHLRHPNITHIYDICERGDLFYIIVERCGSDLNSLFTIPNYDGHTWIPALARDVLQAVDYIHREGFVHKDLHPGNIFVSWMRDRMAPQKPVVVLFKVGDLGITREESNIDIFNTMLAQWMLPPEALDPDQFGPVGRSIDVYHIGLVLLSLLLGRVPEFTKEEVLAGRPREIAEQMQSVYSPVVALALRRHASARPSIPQLWSALIEVIPRGLWPV